jgi:nucleoside-diphosphate-sugar epimerase
VEGDLLEANSLKPAVEDVSANVHLAAVFRTQNADDIWRANLDGTKNLIAASKAYAPQVRFVKDGARCVCSTSTTGYGDSAHVCRRRQGFVD